MVRATVLFADIVGFTEMSEKVGAEQAYSVVTGCLQLLDGIARKYGGSVDKYQGDCLMAAFGYPVPMDDSARAGIAAALEMRQRVAETDEELGLAVRLGFRAGINSGAMVAGDIRGPVVREFHVLGDTVNVAARLKAKAPLGSIYVGPGSHEEARDHFRFRDLEPLQLKGKSERVASYEVLDSREPLHQRVLGDEARVFSRFVGRVDALETLRGALGRLGDGAGGLVILGGEEGVGKSRLLAELGREPAIADVRVHQTRPPRAGARRSGQLAATLAQGLAEDGGSVPTPSDSADLAPSLEAAADAGPLVVVLEDLDRADSVSLDTLAACTRLAATKPVLFVAVGREGSASLERLAQAAGDAGVSVERISLGPLEPEQSRVLIDAVAEDPAEISPAARRAIETRGAGNPARIILGVFLAPALGSEQEQASDRPERSSEAERRRATILFADITGFTAMTEKLGPATAYPIVADCLRLLDEIARRHGGTVDKYLGDCVMALFGVPAAIEDAPRAALNAAIEMRRGLRQYNLDHDLPMPLDVHTGIHTGRSIAGDVSGPLIREFAVMGEPVVAAAALTDLAEAGEIFAGPETWRLTRGRFDYRPGSPLAIPGSADPVASYQLLSTSEQLYRSRAGAEREIFSELVGRDAEMERLRAGVAELATGQGGFVALVGEAGLGKSRLVAELGEGASQDADSGPRLLEGRSLSTGGQLSFHPFADLLRSWAGIDDDDDDDAAVAKVEAAVRAVAPEDAQETLPFLAAVMGTPLTAAQQERLASVKGDLLDRLIHDRLIELFRRSSAQRPLLLVFDDLHWADLSSIELLESLQPLATTHPILFLHVLRPHFAATSGRVLEFLEKHHGPHLQVLELHPLDREAIRLLINNLFRGADIPQRVRAMIAEKAGGNPFYVEEVARSLIEEGAVERVGDGFHATPKIHEVEIPETVHEVIEARIDRLPLRQRELVHVAGVVGRSFHLEVLRQIFEDKDALLADLAALEAGSFVVGWDQLQGTEFAFKHPLIQEVAYESLLEGRREELHLRVGNAIETALTPNLPGYHAMLAYHFGKGGDTARAEEALFRAGDEAARSAASNQALHFFREASQLYVALHADGGDPAKRALLEKNVGMALYNRGQLLEAEDHFNAALRHLGERVPANQVGLVLRFLFNLIRVLPNLWIPFRRRQAARDVDREAVDIMMRRNEVETFTSPTRFLFDTMDTIARLDGLEPATVPSCGAWYSATVGTFAFSGLSFAVSRRFLAKAEPMVDPDDEAERLFFGMMKHFHHFLSGDWNDAYCLDDALVEAGVREMRLWSLVNYLGLETEQHIRRGHFGRARERMALIDSIWERFDYDLAKTNHYWLPTCMLLEQRRLPEAVTAAEVYHDENPEDLLHILALSYKAMAQTRMDELDAAETTLERAAAVAARAKYPPPFHLSSYRTARLVQDLARLEAAGGAAPRALRRRARRSCRAALRMAGAVAYRGPEIFRLAGRRAWLENDAKAARVWWERSLDAAERIGTRPEWARTALELGVRLGDGGGAEGLRGRAPADWLAEARQHFEALELDWDRMRLEKGLAS